LSDAGRAPGSPQPAVALAAEHCRRGAPKLPVAEVDALLATLPGWRREGERLVRAFTFPDFHATMAFVNAVAGIAHDEDHHPDLAVSYSRCIVAYATHDAGGITRNDLVCAARVARLVA
jgi:4a-hydroxytetrahydrobiopterin dehydratase